MIVLPGVLAANLAKAMGAELPGARKSEQAAEVMRSWSAAELDEAFARALGAETRDCDICLVFNDESALVKYVGRDTLRVIARYQSRRYLERDPRAFID